MAAKRKPEEPKKGAPEFMSTYGDLVTLLLCFFVLLYSMSTLDVVKFQQVAASMANSVIDAGGGAGISNLLGSGIMDMPNIDKSINDSKENFQTRQDNTANIAAQEELKQMSSDFKTYFAQNNVSDKVDVEVFDQYIKINLKDGVLFDSGKANIRPDAISILNIIAGELQNYPGSDFRIEGHTDNSPINTVQFPSNLHLSAIRAINVGLFFVEEKGISRGRIGIEGFGEDRPIASNDTPEGRAQNRRVEIKVLSSYYSNSSNTVNQ